MPQNNKSQLKLLSVIIPAYKQEETILTDIKNITQALHGLKYDFEIIVVVDGMIDATFKKASQYESKNVKVFGYKRNQGKGYAIRYGMSLAKGEIIGFIDAGMDIHTAGFRTLLQDMDTYTADIVIGSKCHPDSNVHYPMQRKLISLLSQLFVRIVFGLSVKDTQVGMKFFRREVIAAVLPRLVEKRFAFDIEILSVANQLGYTHIIESPIQLSFIYGKSTVSKNLLGALYQTFCDTISIFIRLKLLHFYIKKNYSTNTSNQNSLAETSVVQLSSSPLN